MKRNYYVIRGRGQVDPLVWDGPNPPTEPPPPPLNCGLFFCPDPPGGNP